MEDTRVFASCHNHSCFSDAAYTPEKLAQLAHSMGHGGIILTDHDTVKGTYFMNKKYGIGFLLGFIVLVVLFVLAYRIRTECI